MGQTPSSSSASSASSSSSSFLAIHAVAKGCCQRWGKKEMRGLMRRMKARGARSGKPTLIYRCDLETAVKETGLSGTTEAEILDKVYTLLDEQGEDQVPYQRIMMSVVLLLPGDDVADKLAFALELYEAGRPIQEEEKEEEEGEDATEGGQVGRRRRNKKKEEEGVEKEEGGGEGGEEEEEEEEEALYSPADVRMMLRSMNNMAAFLGDEPLLEKELDALLSSVFPSTLPSSSSPSSSSSPNANCNPFDEEVEEGGREGGREEEEGACIYKTADEIMTGLKKHPFLTGTSASAVGGRAPRE